MKLYKNPISYDTNCSNVVVIFLLGIIHLTYADCQDIHFQCTALR